MNDLEERLKVISKGKRITQADVEAEIASCFFVNGWDAACQDPTVSVVGADKIIPQELRVITLALVTTRSGFTVIGTSGCADPANFNQSIGEEIAKRNAVSQLWGHMGYELRVRLHEEEENERQEAELRAAEERFGQMDYTNRPTEGLDDAIGRMDE